MWFWFVVQQVSDPEIKLVLSVAYHNMGGFPNTMTMFILREINALLWAKSNI